MSLLVFVTHDFGISYFWLPLILCHSFLYYFLRPLLSIMDHSVVLDHSLFLKIVFWDGYLFMYNLFIL